MAEKPSDPNQTSYAAHDGALVRWSVALDQWVPVHAADHFTRIVDGLRVWNNDLERGHVDLSRVGARDGWFDVVVPDLDGRRVLANWERVTPTHPFTGEDA